MKNADSGVNTGPATGCAVYVVSVEIEYQHGQERLSEIWQCSIVAMNINQAVGGAIKWAKLQWPEHYKAEAKADTLRRANQAYAVIEPIAVDAISEGVINP